MLALALACSGDHPNRLTLLTDVTSTDVTSTDTVTMIGAGDIAGCPLPYFRDEMTAALIQAEPDAVVFAAGDNAYPSGTARDYRCYQQSWGAFKDRTWPVLGNHEREMDSTATAYFDYFNGMGVDSGVAGQRGKGYYAVDYGRWRILFLNSERNIPEQAAWIYADLKTHPTICQMMILHKPLFTSGGDVIGPSRSTRPLYRAFYDNRGDVVISGHVHNYERTALVRPDGTIDTLRGMRQFVVGSGGHGHLHNFLDPPKPYSQVRRKTWGVLWLKLMPKGYAFEYRDIRSVVRDSGNSRCL